VFQLPRYYFIIDNGSLIPDDDGTELPDLQTAQSEAVKAAGELLKDLHGRLWEGERTWQMHVTDAQHMLLFSLSFTAKMVHGKVVFLPKP
jgi:hypothetical protein